MICGSALERSSEESWPLMPIAIVKYRLNPEEIEDYGEQAAGHHDHDDRHDHRLRRRIADRRRAVATLKAAQAAGDGYQYTIKSSLEDAAEQIDQGQGRDGFPHVTAGRQIRSEERR